MDRDFLSNLSITSKLIIIGIVITLCVIVFITVSFGSTNQDKYTDMQSIVSTEETQTPLPTPSADVGDDSDTAFTLIAMIGKILLVLGVLGIILSIIQNIFED